MNQHGYQFYLYFPIYKILFFRAPPVTQKRELKNLTHKPTIEKLSTIKYIGYIKMYCGLFMYYHLCSQ